MAFFKNSGYSINEDLVTPNQDKNLEKLEGEYIGMNSVLPEIKLTENDFDMVSNLYYKMRFLIFIEYFSINSNPVKYNFLF